MSVAYNQVTVGVTATKLNTTTEKDSIYGKTLRVANRGAADVFLGDASVTTTTGYKLKIDERETISLGDNEDLYGIVATATQPVHILLTGV